MIFLEHLAFGMGDVEVIEKHVKVSIALVRDI
jgi:hypothetical protein